MVALQQLLGADYVVEATDRSTLVITTTIDPAAGEKEIQHVITLQSDTYELLPNVLIEEAAQALLPADYSVFALMTQHYEFSIQLARGVPIYVGELGLIPSLIIRHSYSGKSRFTIQGITPDYPPRMPAGASYYTLTGPNSLIVWADLGFTHQQYVDWLRATGGNGTLAADPRRGPRRPAEPGKLSAYLQDRLALFLGHELGHSVRWYQRFNDAPAGTDLIGTVSRTIRLPRLFERPAGEELQKRTREKPPGVTASLLDLYLSVNKALLTVTASQNLSDRYDLDQRCFHALAYHWLVSGR